MNMKDKQTLIKFLDETLFEHLARLDANTTPDWGTMSAQQMIEHVALPFKVAYEKLQITLLTPEDKLEKVKSISLMSDRAMPKLFNNPALVAEMVQLRNVNMQNAIAELKNDINSFHAYFKGKEADYSSMHNIFGKLNYEEWLWFHYKHCIHHLAQFRLIPYQDRIKL